MHHDSEALLRAVRRLPDVPSRVAALRGAFEGERCFLISCGPSTGDLPADGLRDLLSRQLVMAVKQAYDILPGVADIHLLNTTSLQRYKYLEPRPLVVFERGRGDAPHWDVIPDIELTVAGTDPLVPRPRRLAERLAVRQNYDDYLLERRLSRPWGPGVILEVGMYLAVHMGVKELTVAGWDLGPPAVTMYDHFYGQPSASGRGRIGRLWRKVARRGPFLAYQYLRHKMGGIAYEGTVEADDTEVSVASSFGTYQWLLAKGVRLRLLSTRSYLDPRIPRVTWEQVVDEIG